MPYSSEVFDSAITEKFSEWRYCTYLDIGAGAGKYGRLIRSILPHSELTAVEIEPEYVARFDLHSIYNTVVQIDVRALVESNQDAVYDVVIFGDVIEHLPKSAGIDLIHFFSYRCKKMLVVYPSKYVQYSADGKASESHRSVWCPADFDTFACEHHSASFMNLSIVNGYLDDPDAVFPTGI
jgi:phospholipid N-methyltransferase